MASRVTGVPKGFNNGYNDCVGCYPTQNTNNPSRFLSAHLRQG